MPAGREACVPRFGRTFFVAHVPPMPLRVACPHTQSTRFMTYTGLTINQIQIKIFTFFFGYLGILSFLGLGFRVFGIRQNDYPDKTATVHHT